ncbi:MAG: preprotein translocase subunit SecY [Cytophagales bacterium]|nr:MAG: preprotein translocase subunit SecY [Cytophagales bacterium]TAF62457.1 MAG: preprotein translocase subunit SecY [Cytophagales bacterium]
MKKLIDTLRNIFSIEELKNRILLTLGLLVIFRLGSFIVLPGIDTNSLTEESSGGILDLLNVLLGGAFNRASVFALGIMPYISASIVIQLLTVALPYFQRMQKEGESGRKRLNQITRWLTILVTLGQSVAYIKGTIPANAIMVDPTFFLISSMLILTGGTVFCMWLGEKITDRGIGNGISMLIMIGIVSRLPGSLVAEATDKGTSGLFIFLLELVALFFVVIGVVLIIQAVRRIPIQYAKQVAGAGAKRQVMAGEQRSYIPLKVNSAGVMPIIFAQSLMFIPPLVAQAFAQDGNTTAIYIATVFSDFASWEYNLTFGILILVFTFFYTAITINTTQIADDMKQGGSFIPGVKPGEETSEYIGRILDLITFPGAIFLTLIAIMPAFARIAGIGDQFAQFYGGTSLLIMIGVVLDTLQQIEGYLLMQQYEGLMNSGTVTGRTQNFAAQADI